LLAIDNYRTGMIWKLMSKNLQLNAGLDAVFGSGSPASVAEKTK
jgi:hypothetical protein